MKLAREHIVYFVAGEGTSKEGDVDYAAAKASVSKMRNQEREIIKLKAKINEKKMEALKIEKARAQAMFKDMNASKDTQNAKEEKKIDSKELNAPKESGEEIDAQNESKEKEDAEKPLKKRVSFASKLEETREIIEEEEYEESWYEEHAEAFILLGLAAIAAGSFIFARKSMRS